MTRSHSLFAAALLCSIFAASIVTAAPPLLEEPWVVRVAYGDATTRDALGRQLDVWAIEPEDGILIAAVTRAEYEALEAEGLMVEMDLARTRQLHRPRLRQPELGGGIPGFSCYRTVEETLADAADIVAAHPSLATLIDIGDSWEKTVNAANGYDLLVLRLTQSAVGGDKPKLFLIGGIHAREYTTPETVTRFAEMLVAGYDMDPDITWLLDHHEIHLLLQANPDGRKQAETGLSWRKNANDDYCTGSNDRGADLNRNFSFRWGCCGGSSNSPCSTIYRGPSGASEPETMAVDAHVRAIFPDQRDPDLSAAAPDDATGTMIDVHSFGQDVLWSWGFTTTQPPNGAALYSLGRKYAFFNGHRPQHGSLGTTEGTTKDFAYGELGVPGFTFELGTSFFQDCASFESSVLPGNLQALLYAAKAVRAPYRLPAGPDVVDLEVSPAAANPLVGVPPGGVPPVGVVSGGTAVTITATIDDTRYSTANGTEPTQTIAAADFYLDVPPWSSAPVPTPQAMTAVDGTFDSTVEAVTAVLDTTGLPLGRHTLFVEGEDAAGNRGVVSAGFLYILDPASAPRIEGFVRSNTTGLPLAGTVTAGPTFGASTNPGTGFYSLLLPSGSYTVTASAPGHAPVAIENVLAQDFQTIAQDFALVPFIFLIDDDVEGGNIGWTADAPWAISTDDANSPTHAWTDSPGGNYADNRDIALTSAPLDLSMLSGASLVFWHRFDIESGFDNAHVEISTDGGGNWTTVAIYSGQQIPWQEVTLDLPALNGAADARLRFRLETDVSVTRDGWYLDDIILRAAAPGSALTPIFRDGFESGDVSAWTTSIGDN